MKNSSILKMTILLLVLIGTFQLGQVSAQSTEDRQALIKTTAAIRSAFAKGDVAAVVALHHPDIVKYFGGKNVVTGRADLTKGLIQTFKNIKLEFVANKVESTIFNKETAIETSIFTFRSIPKKGGKASIASGRSMVVYVKYKGSPTGWASIREMAQAAP
jgi:ketosteroid isomerase-like protein